MTFSIVIASTDLSVRGNLKPHRDCFGQLKLASQRQKREEIAELILSEVRDLVPRKDSQLNKAKASHYILKIGNRNLSFPLKIRGLVRANLDGAYSIVDHCTRSATLQGRAIHCTRLKPRTTY